MNDKAPLPTEPADGCTRKVDEPDSIDLSDLHQRLEEHLAPLRAPGAGDRLRAAANGPTRLFGKVRAGESY